MNHNSGLINIGTKGSSACLRPLGKRGQLAVARAGDFYAPAAKLIIEIDGAQHFEEQQKVYDEKRSLYVAQQGLKVLRFDNLEVLKHTSCVLEVIMETMKERIF